MPKYGNILVMSPNNEPMFRCGQDRADWYLKRNLAIEISSNPQVIQLTFKPGGTGHAYDKHADFYLAEKSSQCVVCGAHESDELEITKHHCVPYMFRRLFPKETSRHSMHDVILLCEKCHTDYEKVAYDLKQQLLSGLGDEYTDALCNHPEGVFYKVGSYIRLLLDENKIPEARKIEILNIISEVVGRPVTISDLVGLEEEYEVTRRSKLALAAKHRETILQKYIDGLDLREFSVMWRKHFMDTMKPKYMPKGWDINYWIEQ